MKHREWILERKKNLIFSILTKEEGKRVDENVKKIKKLAI